MTKPRLHPMERDLNLVVMDGLSQLAPLMFQIHQHQRSMEILSWLRWNRLTGQRLLDFFEGDAQRSFLAVIKFVVKHLEKEAHDRPVRASEFGLKKPL